MFFSLHLWYIKNKYTMYYKLSEESFKEIDKMITSIVSTGKYGVIDYKSVFVYLADFLNDNLEPVDTPKQTPKNEI